jgi:AraC-like DNA-binding protein
MSREQTFDPLRTPPHIALANFYPFAPNETAGPHWSESNLFLPATHGRGEVQVGPQRFELRQGQILHVPWAAPIRYIAPARDPFVVIGLHLNYLPWGTLAAPPLHTRRDIDMTRSSMQTPPCPQPFSNAFVISVPPESRLIDIGVAIARAYESARVVKAESLCGEQDLKTDREALLRSLALQFILEMRACIRGGLDTAAHPQAGVVREMMSWLDLAHRRPIRRSEMARRAGMSESALAVAFKAVTGRAPVDFLIDLRLSHARSMLSTSRKRIGEIAEDVGIPDVYYFSKLFKRRIGVSPLQYRKQRRI